MDKCITCGRELHPERAKKYNYCMSRECQEKNAKGLTMVAIGVNKAAEQYLILDDKTKDELASGKYRDQRREFFGTFTPSPDPVTAATAAPAPAPPPPPARAPAQRLQAPASETQPPAKRTQPQAKRTQPPAQRPQSPVSRAEPRAQNTRRQPWTGSQQRLALLYNEQGLRPDEIASKLGLSTYQVTQILLDRSSRGKL